MTRYLALEDALLAVERLGFHVRDAGLLASSLARPTTTVTGTDVYPSLELKVASLLESLARNHALIDGNKRLSWTVAVLMLWINGFRHDMTPERAFDLVLAAATGTADLNDLASTIRTHLIER